MKILRLCLVLLIGLTAVMRSPPAVAQDLEKQKQALDVISQFANSLCDSVKDHGKTEAWEVSSDAKAQLDGVVKKIADLGVGAAAKYTTSEYQGVLQSDLGKLLNDQTNCRLSVFKDLKDKLLPSAPRSQAAPTPEAPDTLVTLSASIPYFQGLRMGMHQKEFSRALQKYGFKLVEARPDVQDAIFSMAGELDRQLASGLFVADHLVNMHWGQVIDFFLSEAKDMLPVERRKSASVKKYLCDEQAAIPAKLELNFGKPYREFKGYTERPYDNNESIFFDAADIAVYTKAGTPSILMVRKVSKSEIVGVSTYARSETNLFSVSTPPLIGTVFDDDGFECELDLTVDHDASDGIDDYLREVAYHQSDKTFEEH